MYSGRSYTCSCVCQMNFATKTTATNTVRHRNSRAKRLKIVPSKSKKILSILQNYMIFSHYKWIIRHLFDFSLENKSNFMIISEKLSCCHLHVKFRLRTAPSNCNFQDFFQNQSYKVKIQGMWSQIIKKCLIFYRRFLDLYSSTLPDADSST